MKYKLEYRIENGSLIIDNYFNNLKIGSINGGSVESILNKCKLYDEEYETLLKENEYMTHIAKDFEQLQQENKKLNGVIQTYDILLKANTEENKRLKDNWKKLKEIAKSQSGFKKRAGLKGGVWFEIDELLDKMLELERGDK